MTTPIKLIKLTNGESLVCKLRVDEEKNYATIIEPVRIHKWMSPSDNGEGAFENATFGPWESFSENQIFHVAKSNIITVTMPRDDVINYYHTIIERLKSTPVERMDEPEDDYEMKARRLRKLKDVVDDLNERLGLDDSLDETSQVEEYMYNKHKITKH
jgi:hypothetical protein|tara:strand:- start:3762 stop:4235 length:474 start_codon:yes stop_codon:yes gene_type:complete